VTAKENPAASPSRVIFSSVPVATAQKTVLSTGHARSNRPRPSWRRPVISWYHLGNWSAHLLEERVSSLLILFWQAVRRTLPVVAQMTPSLWQACRKQPLRRPSCQDVVMASLAAASANSTLAHWNLLPWSQLHQSQLRLSSGGWIHLYQSRSRRNQQCWNFPQQFRHLVCSLNWQLHLCCPLH